MAVRTLSRARPRAETGRGYLPVLVIWSSWLVLMAGANLATPLYAVYASNYGFSSLVLTSIFATTRSSSSRRSSSSAGSPTGSAGAS